MGLREDLMPRGTTGILERPKAHPLAVRHATQVSACGVLTHPDDANEPDADDIAADFYHKTQAAIVYERVSPADQTLTDELPTESYAFDNADAAHSLAMAEMDDWKLDKGPRDSSFCWELAWRLEEMLA